MIIYFLDHFPNRISIWNFTVDLKEESTDFLHTLDVAQLNSAVFDTHLHLWTTSSCCAFWKVLYLDILSHSQGETLLGKPNRSEKLGSSEIPFSIFFDFVLTLGETKYK